MYADIFAVLAPILFGSLAGYLWARAGKPYSAEFVGQVVVNIGTPCLILSTLPGMGLERSDMLSLAGAVFTFMAVTGLCGVLLFCWRRDAWRTWLPSLMFPNTGNMGIPLSMFAFGEQGLVFAVGVFCLVTLVQFSLGLSIASGKLEIRGYLRSPIFIATAVAGVMLWNGWTFPRWADNTLTLMGNMAIPLMLIALGCSLYGLRVADAGPSLRHALLRLVLGFVVGWSVAELLGLEGVLRGVVILQSAMPVAVFNYLIAVQYRRAEQAVAGVVVMSTLLSFLSLPALLWFVMRA